jgi:hypothetical protein
MAIEALTAPAEREGRQWKSMRSGAEAPATRCVSISIDGPERPNPPATGAGLGGQWPQHPAPD